MNFKKFLFCNVCTDIIFTLSWGNEIGVSKEYFCDLKKVNKKNMKLQISKNHVAFLNIIKSCLFRFFSFDISRIAIFMFYS